MEQDNANAAEISSQGVHNICDILCRTSSVSFMLTGALLLHEEQGFRDPRRLTLQDAQAWHDKD